MFGYHTSTDQASTAAPRSSVSAAPARVGGSSTSGSPPDPSSSASPGGGSSSSGSSATQTYTGSVAQTRWGSVQLQISVTDHKITDVTVVQQPNGNQRDAEINDSALPILIRETISTQSASIDMVSGATVTSGGYVRSLQAALDEAGI